MSEATHRIRLRGPWNVQRASQEGGGEIAIFHFPEAWGATAGGECGTFRFSRRFGCPTGIGPRQTIWLEIAASATGRVDLNEQDLGRISPGVNSFNVTSRLRDGNQVEVELRRPEGVDAGEEVILEAAIVIETRGESLTPPPNERSPSP